MKSHSRLVVLCVASLATLTVPIRSAIRVNAQTTSQQATASISGVVLTTDAPPIPLRRAIVSLLGGNSSMGRHAISDEQGRFAFESLPAGRYALSASRRSFVSIAYGALRPAQSGAPLIIESGERVRDLKVLLARGAVITGTVRDANGDPVSSLTVRVEATSGIGTSRPFVAVSQTDDQGTYRVFGLPAGSYYVSTRPRVTGRADLVAPSDAEVDVALRELQTRTANTPQPVSGASAIRNIASRTPARPVDFVPVFHPGVFTKEEAAIVAVRAGEERPSVDVTVRMLSTSSVAGRIVNVGERTASEIEVTLNKPGETGPPAGAFRTVARQDGSFRIGGVTPGKHLLAVRAMSAALFQASLGKPGASAPPPAGAPGGCAFAAQELLISGADVADVTLTLRPCLRIEGRVAFESGPSKPALPSIVVALQPAAGSRSPAYVPIRVPATVKPDGTFVLGEFGDVLPGAYQLSVTMASEVGRGWWLDSGTVDGRDILDSPLTISMESASPISVALKATDRHTSLSGSLEILSKRLSVEYTVVVFPTNREWWSAPFRRIKAARASHTGQYVIQDLPPGEYFLAALSDLAPDEWRDRDFLDLIVPSALRFVIGPGEQKMQNLRISR